MSAIELVRYRLCGSRGGGSPSRRDPFRFLDVAAFGCLWTCGFFVDAWCLRLVLFVWGALGTFVFVCFFPVGTSSVCAPAFGGSGVGLGFSRGALFACGVSWFGPLSVGPLLCGFFCLLWLLLCGPLGPQPAEYGAELSPDFSRRCPEAGVGKGLTGRA